MAIGKWIGGFLGFITTGSILGAMAGYAIGSLFDGSDEDSSDNVSGYGGGYSGRPYGGYSQPIGHSQAEGQRNSFLFALMVLSAHIIQADGRIMHSEMEYVRQFLRRSFGEGAAREGDEILRRLFDYRKQQGETAWNNQISQACAEIRRGMPVDHRRQLVAFLAEIIKADGRVDEIELQTLRQTATALGLGAAIADQFFSLGSRTLDDAYRVLGVSPSATDDELRRAYKKMVRENHPDRVAALGDDVRQAATEKLQEINQAKEQIWKARGL